MLLLRFLDQLEYFFLEFHQLLGHLGTPAQTVVLPLQAGNLAVTCICCLAAGRLRLQTLPTVCGVVLTPVRKLGCIEAIAA